MSSCASVPATSKNSQDEFDPFPNAPSSEVSEAFQNSEEENSASKTSTENDEEFNNQFMEKLFGIIHEMRMMNKDVTELDYLEITKENLNEKMIEYGFPRCIANVMFAALNNKLHPYSEEQNKLIPVQMNVDNNYYFNKTAVEKYHAQLYLHPRFKDFVKLDITNPDTKEVTTKVIHLEQEKIGNQSHYVFKHSVLTLQSIKDTILSGLTVVKESRPDGYAGLVFKDNVWQWNPNDDIRINGKHKLQFGTRLIDVTLESIKLVKKTIEGQDIYIPVTESDGMETEVVAKNGFYPITITPYIRGERKTSIQRSVPTEWLDKLIKERVSRL